jgi:hypothetical protein
VPANRASRLALTAAILVVVGVLIGVAVGLVIKPSGQASAAPAGSVDHPAGAADVLLRVAIQPSDNATVPPVPLFTLYGDGSAIVTTAPPAGDSSQAQAPAVANLDELRLSEAGIQAVLRRAEAAGLTGPSATETGSAGVATEHEVFTMSVTGMHRERVFAGDGADPLAGTGGSRAMFASLQAALLDLPSWLPAGTASAPSAYVPTRLAVYVGASEATPPGGSVVAAWPLDASPGARLATFGAASPVAGFRCGVLEGAARDRVLTAAKAAAADTLWRSGKRIYQVVFRPLLPDEAGC